LFFENQFLCCFVLFYFGGHETPPIAFFVLGDGIDGLAFAFGAVLFGDNEGEGGALFAIDCLFVVVEIVGVFCEEESGAGLFVVGVLV